MITAALLPFSGITVEPINSKLITPFYSEFFSEEYHYYIHNDGSLVALFEMPTFEIVFINNLIDKLVPGSSLQVYRLVNPTNSSYYVSIKLPIDTSILNLSFPESLARIFKGSNDLINKLRSDTAKMADLATSLFAGHAKNVPISCNALYSYLLDCTPDNTGFPVPTVNLKSNMSVVLTGRNRCTCLYSLNDYKNLNMSTINILKEVNTYLQYFSILKPTTSQINTIERSFSDNVTLISNLSSAIDSSVARVHTMGIEDAHKFIRDIKIGLFYMSSAFVFNAHSIADLKSTSDLFSKTLYQSNIVPYYHSNSAARHYLSCFPGNANTGYHYHIAYSKFTRQLIHRYFQL